MEGQKEREKEKRTIVRRSETERKRDKETLTSSEGGRKTDTSNRDDIPVPAESFFFFVASFTSGFFSAFGVEADGADGGGVSGFVVKRARIRTPRGELGKKIK